MWLGMCVCRAPRPRQSWSQPPGWPSGLPCPTPTVCLLPPKTNTSLVNPSCCLAFLDQICRNPANPAGQALLPRSLLGKCGRGHPGTGWGCPLGPSGPKGSGKTGAGRRYKDAPFWHSVESCVQDLKPQPYVFVLRFTSFYVVRMGFQNPENSTVQRSPCLKGIPDTLSS